MGSFPEALIDPPSLLSLQNSFVQDYVVLLLKDIFIIDDDYILLFLYQPTDLTEPNPITLLLLCIHLYQRLPHYLPRATVKFEGPLHGTVTKHVGFDFCLFRRIQLSSHLIGFFIIISP